MPRIIKRLQEIRNMPTEKMDVKALADVLREIAACVENIGRKIEEDDFFVQDFHLQLEDPLSTARKGVLTIDFVELCSYKEKE